MINGQSLTYPLTLPMERAMLAYPILNMYTLIKRVRHFTQFRSYGRSIQFLSEKYTLPLLLPEFGCMIALDVLSQRLKEDFMRIRDKYERFYLKNQIMMTKLYNFDESLNRAVSRGTYKFHKISETISDVYLTSLLNDFLLTPSFISDSTPQTPTRWFKIEADEDFRFAVIASYNMNIVYLKREWLKTTRQKIIWLGEKFKVRSTRCYFIPLTSKGVVGAARGYLCLKSDVLRDLDEQISEKGDYFLCLSLGLRDYRTNHPDSSEEGVMYNLVDTLIPLVQSPYDIIPLLFPFFIKADSLRKPILEFTVPKQSVRLILQDFIRHTTPQTEKMVEDYGCVYEELFNRLMTIRDNDNSYSVKVANPATIACLVKKCTVSHSTEGRYVERVLGGKGNLVESLEREINECHYTKQALMGVARTIKSRSKNLHNYLRLCKYFGLKPLSE